MHWIQILSVALAGLTLLISGIGAVYSFIEKEERAAKLFLFLMIVLPVFLLVPTLFKNEPILILWGGLEILALVFGVVVLLPIKMKQPICWAKPLKQIDERTIMFSRNLLQKGSKRYEDYYQLYPQHLEADNYFRQFPGLMNEKAKYFNPATFYAAEATFSVIEHLRDLAGGIAAQRQVKVEADSLTGFLDQWTKKIGAVSFGVAPLEEYHKYSHVGRGTEYGSEVELDHSYAMAITTEMDKGMMAHAPFGPTVMESGQQYVDSGVIALQIAQFLRRLGYNARAHIDGNYRVVCPLVAKDAGLGEIGRMGLLMTPELGPRVRIAVVTTNAPLKTNPRKEDSTMIDFCLDCKKCADVCPGNAISFDDPEEVDGVIRWQINQEACFTLWTKMGTDCGRCVAVCPYSHPDNLLHNLIRMGLKQSPLFRDVALRMDDMFYGRKPASKKEEDWMRVI